MSEPQYLGGAASMSEIRSRARAAEMARQEREAWEHARATRPARSPRYDLIVQGAVIAASSASLLLFLIPWFLVR